MNSNGLVCREALGSEQNQIVEFQLALAFESEKLRLDRTTCARGVEAVFKNPSYGRYFIAERSGKLVGCLLIIPEWSDWRNGVVWWIHSVYVIPEERGNRVFSALYEMIRKQGLEKNDFRGLRLYVDKTNVHAQTVYRKLGMSNHHYELFEWMRDF